MQLFVIFISLLSVFLIARSIAWLKRRRKFVEAIEKLPGPPVVPFVPLLGHTIVTVYVDFTKYKHGTFDILYSMINALNSLYSKEGIARYWLGLKPIVLLFSPETVEGLLTSTTVINKAIEYQVFEPWIGQGLVTSGGSKWRFRRKILTPAFHFRILNDFLPMMNEECTKLLRKITKKRDIALKQVSNGIDSKRQIELNRGYYVDTELYRTACDSNNIESAVLQAGLEGDLVELITLCTLDTICETAFGLNVNAQENDDSEYVKALHELGEMALRRVVRPWLWSNFLFHRTEHGRRFLRARNVMHEFTQKVIQERKNLWLEHKRREKELASSIDKSTEETTKSNNDQAKSMDLVRESSFFASSNKRLAFLDLLLHQHLEAKTMSLADVQEEVDTFMFAGHDTTAMGMSWTLYLIGLHEDIQAKCHEELDRIFDPANDTVELYDQDEHRGSGTEKLITTDITNEHIAEMKYLDRVIKEALRLYPPIPFVAREVTEDLTLAGKYLVPKGSTCVVFTHCLHQNPTVWAKPEVFNPDRFLPENAPKNNFAYIPFSAGPRNCIGQKFAQKEQKVMIAKIMRNYYIKTCDFRDKVTLIGELTLRARKGLRVKLIPRFPKIPQY